MAAPLSEQVVLLLEQAVQLYSRLILVVSPSGKGKTTVLREIAQQTNYPYINLNLDLSHKLLDLTEKQRLLQVSGLVDEIVAQYDQPVILLDNIELLFDPVLKQNPLQLIQKISRQRTIVVSWNGSLDHGHLLYATADHPEYQRYPSLGMLVVDAA